MYLKSVWIAVGLVLLALPITKMRIVTQDIGTMTLTMTETSDRV
jgi:hypothetical protein